uniref:Purple acid phosphatase n=1 Tax=Neobodo designis TaxID=312471 RepID=A0A7S1QH91_NEODS|mmetsp:Transcript_46131/g.142132  ORF Transcript_46131/g.142132 Transcript_46131/m.142132 type:complete len:666 (+) Transcript_46131:34-2031(+)
MRLLATLALLALGAAAAITRKTATTPIEVQLSVEQPPGPFHHDTTVTLRWNVTAGEFDPNLDWVSSWWQPFPDSYIQYFNVTSNVGSATFTLLNARHPYTFQYFRGNTSVAIAAETATPDATYPMGVRTMFPGSDANEVTVMWSSNRSLAEDTIVQYGFAADALDFTVAVEKSLTYTAEELNTRLELPPIARRTGMFENINLRELRCDWQTCYNDFTANELWVEPGLQHVATLRNLAPNTKYFYRVGERGGLMSSVRHFQSKADPSPAASIQVLYVADAGAGYQTGSYAGSASHNACPIPGAGDVDGAQYVWDAIRADPRTALDTMSIMNGDVSYARGWPYVWELFHNETEDIFGTLPVMVSFGNHEFDYGHNPYQLCANGDSGGEAGISTGRRFNQDENHPWFYVKNGPAFIVSLSSEHDPIEQSLWLERDVFPNVDRKVTPWLIVFLHRPLYESSTFDDGPLTDAMRVAYTNLFVRFGVDLVLTGHAHYYDRLCAISSGECNTWGFRDVWNNYVNAALEPALAATCTLPGPSTANTSLQCQAACAKAQGAAATKLGNCTGMSFNASSLTCSLHTCAQPYELVPTPSASVWSMTKEAGASPVYVVDGTAGGTSVPTSTPFSPLTVYKDFMHWGYSRMNINGTHLVWRHHHIDTSVVDEFTLTRE